MEVVAKDSPAEGAEIVFNEVPVTALCNECGEQSRIDEPPFRCKNCDSGKIDIISGREMMVESLEVTEAGQDPQGKGEGDGSQGLGGPAN